MVRYISFLVLVVIIVGIGLLTYKVLASFLLPMFLALLLMVMFRPLHVWLVEKCHGRERVAAGLTTVIIMLIVLLPLSTVLSRAINEGYVLASGIKQDDLVNAMQQMRERMSLNLPPPAVRGNLQRIDAELLALTGQSDMEAQIDTGESLKRIDEWSMSAAEALGLNPGQSAPVDESIEVSTAAQSAWEQWQEELNRLTSLPADSPEVPAAAFRARNVLQRFETALLGGPVMAWLKLQANPDPTRIETLRSSTQSFLGRLAIGTPQVVGGFLIDLLVGLCIMIVSLYYFLADGPGMLASVMRLSPLEDRYEQQLLTEFAKISRAVVMATLLSAFAQGLLAGVAYWFAGFELVFLLTVLTMLLAMVPFVGAAAVWGSCCLWLLLYEQNVGAAIGLAVYGVLVVSMADNVIKPAVLHGQSNLHPLLALLSVLGGVKALGPIGIFVGPMVVAFLQALLVILHSELQTLGRVEGGGEPPPDTTAAPATGTPIA